MLKNLKTVLAAALALLFALTSFAACSGNKPAGGDPTAAPATTAPTAPTQTDAPEATPEQGQQGGMNVGDAYVFGSYEQDNDASNGAEPIEWIILENDGSTLLLISKYALDCLPFGDRSAATWDVSSLRTWLNGEFADAAFTAGERAQIRETEVASGVNPKYDTPAGETVTDIVFILSIEEEERYFTAVGSSECGVTEYALAHGADGSSGDKGTCCWWLRSPGDSSGYVAYVANGWGVTYSGEHADYDSHAVRPVIRITPAQ